MKYDRFQKEAINYIDRGYSVIVSAPTGAGKTVIAEYVLSKCLEQNVKAIYTAPIKALSNQKFRDFQVQYPEQVGILTGDVSINSNANVLIMTTEIFRNKILEEPEMLEFYKWVIFDEVHYLDDIDRGTVWEESIIFMPSHIRILALSATIPNVFELASWINSIHEIELKVVKEEKRPVPLHFYFHCKGILFDKIDVLKRTIFANRKIRSFYKKFNGVKILKISSLIDYIHRNDSLPCIYFSFNRRRCEELANMMSSYNFLNSEERKEIVQTFNDLCFKYDLIKEKSSHYLFPLISRGIAYHHAGMLPTLKEVIERLFTSGLLKVIFTTETFALGINMPARSVIFDELYKNYGIRWSTLKTRDFYQMAGRAGRRGKDSQGFVWCRVNVKKVKWEEIRRIINGHTERVISQLNTSYATLLHLYNEYGEKLYGIYPRSFHYFQSGKKSQSKLIKQMHDKVKVLKKLGHIRNEKLTSKGEFAAQVYGYELPLAELYEKGYLEKMNEFELGVLILSLVYEPRRHLYKNEIPKSYKWVARVVEEENKKIKKIEKMLNISPVIKDAYFQLSVILIKWMKGEAFESIMKETIEDEGEIVRYFRMTMQILKEIRDMAGICEELRLKSGKAFKCINRGVIDAERQLRTI